MDPLSTLLDVLSKVWGPLRRGWPVKVFIGSVILSYLANEKLFPHRAKVQEIEEYFASYLPLAIKWGDFAVWHVGWIFTLTCVGLIASSVWWRLSFLESFLLLNLSLSGLAWIGCLYMSFCVVGSNSLNEAFDVFWAEGGLTKFLTTVATAMYIVAFCYEMSQRLIYPSNPPTPANQVEMRSTLGSEPDAPQR